MGDEKKQPEAKKEPVGVGVIIYPLAKGFRVESVRVKGGKMDTTAVKEHVNPRVSLSLAQTILEELAARGLK